MDAQLEQHIIEVFQKQKKFFATHQTKSIDFRIKQLENFKKVFIAHTDDLCEALFTDLGKGRQEAEYAEIKLVVDELDYCLSHLEDWA